MSFTEKLRAAQARNKSWLCVGLDPDPAHMPPGLSIAAFCQHIIEATHDLACAFKPNLAFFLARGSEGVSALEEVIAGIPSDTPVLLDCKVGDVSSTQLMYGQAAFGRWGVDAITVSPYMGEDAVVPLLGSFPGRGLFILCRSSNPDAPRFQGMAGEGAPLLEGVANAARVWAEAHPAGVVGLVVGATYPNEIPFLRQLAPDLPFLIPGVGAQGGGLEAAVAYGSTADEIGPLIAISRAIIYASRGDDFAEAARSAAARYRDEINTLRGI